MKEFKIGGRVRVKKCTYCSTHLLGKIGTIKEESQRLIGVCFDKKIGGHDLDGSCEFGYGWYVEIEDLELLSDELILIEKTMGEEDEI